MIQRTLAWPFLLCLRSLRMVLLIHQAFIKLLPRRRLILELGLALQLLYSVGKAWGRTLQTENDKTIADLASHPQ